VKQEILRIHGHDLACTVTGDGPTMLLVHGMAGSAETWRHVVEPLARDFRIVAPDLPGHGASAKPAGDYSLGALASILRDVLDELDVASATVVGQSLGGGVAMQFAYQFPERIERLVLVGSGGLGREVSTLLRVLAFPGAEYVLPLVTPWFARDAGARVIDWLGSLGLHSSVAEEMWSAYAGLTIGENRQAFIRTLRSVVDVGGQSVSALDRLHLAGAVPTLIVWGEHDTIIPVHHAHRAHEAIAGSRLEIVEGCNHFPHVEQPDRFVTVLRSFMFETEPAGAPAGAAAHRA